MTTIATRAVLTGVAVALPFTIEWIERVTHQAVWLGFGLGDKGDMGGVPQTL